MVKKWDEICFLDPTWRLDALGLDKVQVGSVRGGDYRTVGSKALSAVQKQKKDIGWRNWDKMRDEMRDERRDNAILIQSRRDVVVIVRRVEAVEGRRMPVVGVN